jgi:pimeloyl-ACP methyl ester carboxylesterase
MDDAPAVSITAANSMGSTPDSALTPIVFVHGIGIGLISYLPLIDQLLASRRPILLPEIPYVSGFRPWQSSSSVLQPAVVCGTMTAMLATHGWMEATWIGHSYGSTWLSCMCKYSPHAVAGLVFLDPICFCLHLPRLTKSFVYCRPDPGTVSYVIRTDMIVNWTIQRAFPWAWVSLFVDQIQVSCSFFLSEKDALVPADNVEDYFRRNKIPVEDHDRIIGSPTHFRHPISCTVFRGDGHGDWTDRPSEKTALIAAAVEYICLPNVRYFSSSASAITQRKNITVVIFLCGEVVTRARNTLDTYSFSFYSMHIDLSQWRLVS